MGTGFINTSYKKTIDSLVDGFKERIKNPYYIHTDKKGYSTTYYNQNIHSSTLDEGTKDHYSALGNDSPMRYNKINGLFLYGLEKITVQLENGDWGLEADSITGESIILPNTIIPIANDYFTIDHIEKKLLFKVINVTTDTIENGSNFYKIEYKLDQLENTSIEKQIVDEFNMIINNVGTNFNPVIRKNDYEFIETVDVILERLKTYYRQIFYSERVQAFIFEHEYENFYDPYMTEFLKRNNILKGSDYLYIQHQTVLNRTFAIDYDKTFFRYIELRNKNIVPKIHSQGKFIEEAYSIFNTRLEDYYKIEYILPLIDPNRYLLNNFDENLLERIKYNTKYTEHSDLYKNIIIKFMNDENICDDDIDALEFLDYKQNIELFYNIPIIIFAIETLVKKLLR
ncbi:MAG: hypothetical protein ACRDD7_16710 [Peptostreptococcaceae bacterium]